MLIRGDSELIVKQMTGVYRVKNPDLRILYEEATTLARGFSQSKFEHNYRESNTLADKLANLAMDRKGEVTDPDDRGGSSSGSPRSAGMVRNERPPAAGAPKKTSASSAEHSPEATSAASSVHACPRCGCEISVLKPSAKPASETGPFQCVCGVRMKPREGVV